MTTSILNIKPEEIDNAKKRGKYKVSIINCGRNGILHACLFAEAGFRVICVDSNRLMIKQLSRGRVAFLNGETKLLLKKNVENGHLTTTSNIRKAVAESDIIAITTKAKINSRKKVNYLNIEKTCKQVGSNFRRGSLVIVINVVGPGTTESLIRKTLENTSGFKIGTHFGLAYSPIQLPDKQNLEKLANHKRIVAAADKNSLDAASTILDIITKDGVIRTIDVKAAEATKLFESVQQYINIALANEIACFCEKAGIDYLRVQELAEKSAYNKFVSPTLTRGNIHEEPYLLLEEAENVNVKLRIPAIARDINEEILRHAVSLIKEALRSCGKSLRRARISLMGISRTPNTKDKMKIAAKKIVKTLETKGSRVSLYDPYLSGKKLTDSGYSFKKSLKDAMKGVDCLVIFTGHNRFKRLSLNKLKILGRMPVAIVDLEGVIDPEKVEMKGLIYRGLGRGGLTK